MHAIASEETRKELRRQLRRAGVRPSDIDEAEGIALSRLVRRMRNTDQPIVTLASYLRVLAIHTRADKAREELRRQRHERGSARRQPIDRAEQEERATAQELSELLARACAKLSPLDAWVLQQHYFRERSVQQIALALGHSRQSVLKRINRVLESLRRYMSR